MSTDSPVRRTRAGRQANVFVMTAPEQSVTPRAKGERAAARGRATARALAEPQSWAVGRRQLAAEGVPRWVVKLELRTGRWQRQGRQALVVHNGPLSEATLRAIAVLEVGSKGALDGVSALLAAGATGLTDTGLVVSTPKGSTPRRPAGVRVRETRRFREEDVLTAGVRRMRPAVAALHAALWAVSDRQATLFLMIAVQQKLARVEDIATALARVRRHKRRRMLTALLVDLAGGVHSLGELDVGAGLQRRGLPVPTRQAIRKRPSGTEYLDCEFLEYDLVLEVDGVGHNEVLQQLSDLVRDIRLASEGRTVIRIPLSAWRLDEEAVLTVLEDLFVARGWVRPRRLTPAA